MKIVLAYSGGLDTSIALAWLQKAYDADVVAFCADLGQNEDLSLVERRAHNNGASAIYIKDLRDEFISDFAFPTLRASALYERRYHMAASLGRPLIAKRLVEIAHRERADAVAHGATGKGNDQVRFFSSVTALNPDLKVIAPVMEWNLKTRSQQIEYAREHSIEMPPFKTSPYSRDSNLWGTSVECGILDDITQSPPDDAFTLTDAPGDVPAESIELTFERSIPTHLNGERLSPALLVERLNEIGGRHGIGRLDIIENRLVGFKVRGVYESPAAEILSVAKRELDDLVHERDLLHLMPYLSQRYAELVYDGRWFSEARRSLDLFFEGIAQIASGTVKLELATGRVTPVSRAAEHSLYNLDIASYESEDGFDQTAGVGFAYIWSMQRRVDALRLKQRIWQQHAPLNEGPPEMKTSTTIPAVYPSSGGYAHSIVVEAPARWLFISGTMGLDMEWEAAHSIEAQLELIWDNIRAILQHDGFSVDNVVHLTCLLSDPAHSRLNAAAISKALKGRVVPRTVYCVELLDQSWLAEIQVIAAQERTMKC